MGWGLDREHFFWLTLGTNRWGGREKALAEREVAAEKSGVEKGVEAAKGGESS